jgi:hypothetical protein
MSVQMDWGLLPLPVNSMDHVTISTAPFITIRNQSIQMVK